MSVQIHTKLTEIKLGMLTLFYLFVSHQASLGCIYSVFEQAHFSHCAVCAPLHYSVALFYFKYD